LKTQYFKKFLDLNKREFLALLPLIVGTLLTGILPDIFLSSLHSSVNTLIELLYF